MFIPNNFLIILVVARITFPPAITKQTVQDKDQRFAIGLPTQIAIEPQTQIVIP